MRRFWWVGLLAPLLTGFSGCWVVSSGIANPYDYMVASDGTWVGVAMNDHIELLPVGKNPSPAQALGWSGPRICKQAVGGGDPSILVDRDGHWWFSSMVWPKVANQNTVDLCIAVSSGTDPTGPYRTVLLPGIADGHWLDVTADKVTATGIRADGLLGTTVFSRNDILAGAFVHSQEIGYTTDEAWHLPARNVSLAFPNPAYLMGPSSTVANAAELLRVTGVPGIAGGISVEWAQVPVAQDLHEPDIAGTEPDGSQVGFPSMTPGVVTNDTLWIAHVDAKMTLQVVALSGVNDTPWAPTLTQHMSLPPSGGSGLGCPALMASPENMVAVSYAENGPSLWLSGMLQMRHPEDPPSTMRAPEMFAPGVRYWNTPGLDKRLDYCAGALAWPAWATPPTFVTVAPYIARPGDANEVMVDAFVP